MSNAFKILATSLMAVLLLVNVSGSRYSIASLTKTFAATLVMQFVEQGKLDLDEPMSHYSTDFKNDSVKVKHLLSHTSGGPTPGERYNYDGNQFDYLTTVIEKKTGKSFREVNKLPCS